MPMFDDKKKLATIIVGKIGDRDMQEGPKNEMGDELDADMGLKVASEEMIQAIDKKDPEMLMSALKDFISMCYESPMEPEDE